MTYEYKRYAEQTGHDRDCAWVHWVVDGKYYPNPGCTCCRYVLPPEPKLSWWRKILNRVLGL